MDKEISQAVYLAVKLLSISALLSIVMFTVFIGKSFRDDVVEDVVVVNSSLESGQISSLSVGDTKVMPKVSFYYILYKEHPAVAKFTYNRIEYKILPTGQWTPKDARNGTTKYNTVDEILKESGLGGKVAIDINKIDSNSYEVSLRDIKDIKEVN